MAKSGQGYWGSITDKGALYLAQKRFKRATYQVFFYLIRSIKVNTDNVYPYTINKFYENMTGYTNKKKKATDQEDQIMLSRGVVYTAFDELIKSGILLPEETGYFINPNVYYKGNKIMLLRVEQTYLVKMGIKKQCFTSTDWVANIKENLKSVTNKDNVPPISREIIDLLQTYLNNRILDRIMHEDADE